MSLDKKDNTVEDERLARIITQALSNSRVVRKLPKICFAYCKHLNKTGKRKEKKTDKNSNRMTRCKMIFKIIN